MKLNALLVRTLGILMLLFIAASCEDDFLEIGDGLVDSSNFTSGVEAYNVVAYNEQLVNKNAVQTNGLNVGILGFYNDPLYGTTTASTLSQVGLTTYNRTYGTNPVIDSIVFTMPYFSTQSVNEESETVYTLDSVSGLIICLQIMLRQIFKMLRSIILTTYPVLQVCAVIFYLKKKFYHLMLR